MQPFLRTDRNAQGTRRTPRSGLLIAGLSLLAACSSGSDNAFTGGGSGGTPDPFEVEEVNVLDGSIWQLNRAIEITFTKEIDFDTVSLTTIQIVDSQGVPAVGSFTAKDARTVRFQPLCPTNNESTNGGLLQGRNYRITVPSESNPGLGGGVTVETTAGERLDTGANVAFTTPAASDPLVLFVDAQPGPPRVRVRRVEQTPEVQALASYVEFVGRDDDGDGEADREFIEFNNVTQRGEISQLVPLNFYSRPDEQFEFVLNFDQPIRAGSTNINSGLVGLEYLTGAGDWETVPSSLSLESNCTAIGATVRLRPEGVMPQGADIRVVVRAGFSDLTGDTVPADLTGVAVVTADVAAPGQVDPDDGVDEILERFDFGGTESGSREDTEISSANPRALWSSDANPGTVSASFAFGGTGGPGGQFSWRIDNEVILNTDTDTIQGGPGFVNSLTQVVIGGVINVKDLEVTPSGRLTIVGPNPCTILATGTVRINGPVSVNGADTRGVNNLNTANIPEPGAAGNAGGGDGGTGSFLTNQSTPRGGTGEGAFGVPGGGGQGGETGYSANTSCNREHRRGAGGGGGRFGPDIRYRSPAGNFVPCQMLVGMDVERGIIGSLDGTGAISQSLPAMGGMPGPSPFLDPFDDNNFFGVVTKADGTQVRGELPGPWAGAGGGAGGDAVQTGVWPIAFNLTRDEKGSGGGGGAGGLQILAVGNIVVDERGTITADGGTGGGGESGFFFDRIGGGSGGGAGGHIILSSASEIIIKAQAEGPPTVGDFYQDDPNVQAFHVRRPLSALGGQNGVGRGPGDSGASGDGRCGSGQAGPKRWNRDSIPFENFEGDTSTPPRNAANAISWAAWCAATEGACATQGPLGETPGAGGDGGPGIIQLHVADPPSQLIFDPDVALVVNPASGLATDLPLGYSPPTVYGTDTDPTRACVPPPFGWTEPGAPVDFLVPFFSSTSESFSDWISLGLARVNPGAPNEQLDFLFAGTDPATGRVLQNGEMTQELAPVIPPTTLSTSGALPSVDGATSSFSFDGATVVDPSGIYRQNPALLREFALRLTDGVVSEDFSVQSATYDEAADRFDLVVDPRGAALLQLLGGPNLANAENLDASLIPFFFRLITQGELDRYPAGTDVFIRFDATTLDPATGRPSADPAESLSGGLTSAFRSDINDLETGQFDFIRFQVQFRIDTDDPILPAIDFLKIPFRF